MIAACPKCHTRYRVQPEQLGPDGARLRCSSCNAVFRVRAPAPAPAHAPAPAASERGASGEAPHEARPPGSTPGGRAASEGGGARSLQAREASALHGPAERSASGARASEARRDAAEARQVPRSEGLEDRRSDPFAHRQGPVSDPAPEPGPRYDRERLVVVAHADPDAAKSVAEALEEWGLETLVACDGVEAMLAIQRALPRAVVLDAALPKMYGFQVCEIVKRNESLRETRVVLVGAIHKEERYRRAPSDLYGADVYVEPPDLPDALLEILTRFGLPLRADAAPSPLRPAAPYGHVARGAGLRDSRTEPLLGEEPAPAAHPEPPRDDGPARDVTREAPPRGSAPGGRSASAPAPAPRPLVQPADPLAAERAKAERLARIIVSDIVLYNPEKFAAAARAGGDVAVAMRDELEEGRALFRDRIDAQVRAERDHLAEELGRAARARGGR